MCSQIRIREVLVRSALTRSRLFDYCVNPYAGCANACVYCYARFATRFSHPGEPWGSFVDVRINAPVMLERQLHRARRGDVYMSSVCDAWQKPEAQYGISRRCLSLLVDWGYPLFLQTKSALAERDFDLLSGCTAVQFGVTLTTQDAFTASIFEPGASSPAERLRVLQEAKRIGLRTFVFLGPLLPGLSDRGHGLGSLFADVAGLQPDILYVDRLNRRAGMWRAVCAAVSSIDPALLPEYRRILFSAESSDYEVALRHRVEQVASEHGMLQRIHWCF